MYGWLHTPLKYYQGSYNFQPYFILCIYLLGMKISWKDHVHIYTCDTALVQGYRLLIKQLKAMQVDLQSIIQQGVHARWFKALRQDK